MTDPYFGDCENCAREELIDYNTNLCSACYRAFNNGYKAADFMDLKPIDAQDRATHYVISHALFDDYKKRFRAEEREHILGLLQTAITASTRQSDIYLLEWVVTLIKGEQE